MPILISWTWSASLISRGHRALGWPMVAHSAHPETSGASPRLVSSAGWRWDDQQTKRMTRGFVLTLVARHMAPGFVDLTRRHAHGKTRHCTSLPAAMQNALDRADQSAGLQGTTIIMTRTATFRPGQMQPPGPDKTSPKQAVCCETGLSPAAR